MARRYIGGVGNRYSSVLKFDENEFMPDPNRSVSAQVKEKQKQKEVDAKIKQQQKQKQEKQLAEDFDAVNVLDAVGATGIPVVSEAGDLASAAVSAGRGDYTAAGLSLAGVMAPFAGGKVLKEGAKFVNKTEMADRINLAIKNNDAKIIESDPRFTKEQKTEILTNSKMPWNQVAKEVEFTNYGKVKDRAQLSKLTIDATKGVGQIGKSIDAKGFKVSDLSPDNVKKIGNKGGRDIYEVTYPNGEKLKFWESSGGGGKPVALSSRNASKNAKNSKGYFGVVAGDLDGSAVGMSDSWFIKSDGWERGYGSKSIEDTGLWLRDLKKSGKLK